VRLRLRRSLPELEMLRIFYSGRQTVVNSRNERYAKYILKKHLTKKFKWYIIKKSEDLFDGKEYIYKEK
jgi:hypothetical protein